MSYASPSLQVLGGVYRLRMEAALNPEVSTARSPSQGEACGGRATSDLLLRFTQGPSDVQLREFANLTGPCRVSAQPIPSGMELRLSFLAKSNTEPQLLIFRGDGQWGVDFWWEQPKPLKRRQSARQNLNAKTPTTKTPQELSQAPGQILDLFENNESWDKVLGAAVTAMDLNSPELNRFRLPNLEQNEGLSTEFIERQKLQVPHLGLPRMDQFLNFAPEVLNLEDFKLEDIPLAEQERDRRRSLEAVNLIALLMRRGEWARAERSFDIYTRSDVGRLEPKPDRFRVFRAKTVMELGKQTKNREVLKRGLDLYRDSLRLLAGRGDAAASSAEFVLLESLREMADLGLWYNAASLLAWSNRYSWTDRVVERLQFLRGEVFFRLGFFVDARSAFQDFFSRKSVLPISAAQDRRLMPFAAFRMGDTAFAQGDFVQAAQLYSQALQQVPTLNKLSFEGLWLPEEVRSYPQVLFNRSEAYVRLGKEADALKDLRAFLFVAPTHPEVGLIYFRIGSLLRRAGAPDDVPMGAWRECVFKSPKSLGGRLCEAARASVELRTASQSQWPRLIGRIETASPQSQSENFWGSLSKDALEVYTHLLRADSFLHLGRPMQALVILEPLKTLNPGVSLKAWLEEYTVAALSGVMKEKIERRQFRQVVEDYESRRTTLFFRFVRPEILFRVAQAYEGLGLWALAQTSFEVASQARQKLERKELRPFDPIDEEWAFLDAHLAVRNFRADRDPVKPVEEKLLRLPEASPKTLEYKLFFYEASGNKKREAEVWSEWEKTQALNWKQLNRWTQVLSDLNDDNGALSLLEERVGAWFRERQTKTAENPPPSELLYRLASLRARANRASEALPLMDYLLAQNPASLAPALSVPMLLYRKAEFQRASGMRQQARQTFEQVRQLAPQTLWGQLSASAARDLETLESSGTR